MEVGGKRGRENGAVCTRPVRICCVWSRAGERRRRGQPSSQKWKVDIAAEGGCRVNAFGSRGFSPHKSYSYALIVWNKWERAIIKILRIRNHKFKHSKLSHRAQRTLCILLTNAKSFAHIMGVVRLARKEYPCQSNWVLQNEWDIEEDEEKKREHTRADANIERLSSSSLWRRLLSSSVDGRTMEDVRMNRNDRRRAKEQRMGRENARKVHRNS
jgi:hypothetical protein